MVATVLDKLKCDLAGDANEYTPIYRLPDDILVEIWDWLSVDDRIGLTAISKRWRRVALQTSRLWKYLHISPHVNYRRIMGLLSRARSAPLHIVLDSNVHPPCIRFPYSWRRGSVPLPIQSDHTGPYSSPPVDYFSRHSEIANNIIGRAVVLHSFVEIPQPRSHLGFSGVLSIESLQVPMPWLQSLRLAGTSPKYKPGRRAVSTTHDLFLFSQTTPRLRHVSFTSFHPAWSDPIYSHLTYIKIQRPYSLCDIKTLHRILQRCPLLTDLHLDSVFVDHDASPLPVVFLPALKACVIRDKHALSILSFIRCFRPPQLSHLDVTTVNYPMMNHLSVIDAPLIDFREIVEVELPNEFSTSHIIKLRLGTPNGLITHQVDYALDGTTRLTLPTWEVQQADLLERITTAPFLFAKVVTLKISPIMSRGSMERLFVLFPHIKTLKLYGSFVQRDHYNLNTHSNFNLLHVLGVTYCTRLAEMRITVDPQYHTFDLLHFLSARASKMGGCRRLEVLVVSSATRLRTTLHTLMASKVGKLVWKQAKPYRSYDSRRSTPALLPDVDEASETSAHDFAPWDEGDLTPVASRQLYVDPSNVYFNFPA
jgi:hypothetical protein